MMTIFRIIHIYLFKVPEIAFHGDFLGTQRDFAIAIFLLTPRKWPWKAISWSWKSYILVLVMKITSKLSDLVVMQSKTHMVHNIIKVAFWTLPRRSRRFRKHSWILHHLLPHPQKIHLKSDSEIDYFFFELFYFHRDRANKR